MKRPANLLYLICSVFILIGLSTTYSETASAEKLRLVTVNWEPFYGDSLPQNGFFSALSIEAFKRAGYETELHFIPWKRAITDAKQGHYDGILGAYFEEERTKYFAYTDVIYSAEEVFIHRANQHIPYTTLNDLKIYKIGGLAGAAPIEELSALGFKTQPTSTELASLRKLAIGRIDLMVIDKARFYYDLKNKPDLSQYQDTFEVLSPAFKQYEMYNPISLKRDDAHEITERFNKALETMKFDGTYESILHRFDMR